MNKNTIFTTLIAIVSIGVFLTGAYYLTNQEQETVVYEQLKNQEGATHVKWAADGSHTLVEFSDLQCPACKSYHDYISQNIEASGSADPAVMQNIRFVYRHFPLTQIHGNAYAAALAAEAAGNQNAFFEMANSLFDSQGTWSSQKDPKEHFMQAAKELELDTKAFERDYDEKAGQAAVDADAALGDEVNVRGTPSFYLDGVKIDVNKYDDFKALLEETAKS